MNFELYFHGFDEIQLHSNLRLQSNYTIHKQNMDVNRSCMSDKFFLPLFFSLSLSLHLFFSFRFKLCLPFDSNQSNCFSCKMCTRCTNHTVRHRIHIANSGKIHLKGCISFIYAIAYNILHVIKTTTSSIYFDETNKKKKIFILIE